MVQKVIINARVVVEPKGVFNFGKLYDDSLSVKEVVDSMLQKAGAAADRALILKSVAAAQS